MAVKALRIFLAAVVVIMSLANILFISENWNTGNIERNAMQWEFEKENDGEIVVNEAIDQSPVEGMYHLLFNYHVFELKI